MVEDRIILGIVAVLLVIGVYFLFMSKKESHNTGQSELPDGSMDMILSDESDAEDETMGDSGNLVLM